MASNVNNHLLKALERLLYLLQEREDYRKLWDALHGAYAATGDENLFVFMTQVAVQGGKVNDNIKEEVDRLTYTG